MSFCVLSQVYNISKFLKQQVKHVRPTHLFKGCISWPDIFSILQEIELLRKQNVQLSEENGKLVGHKNHKQKIEYLVKLKKENTKLHEVSCFSLVMWTCIASNKLGHFFCFQGKWEAPNRDRINSRQHRMSAAGDVVERRLLIVILIWTFIFSIFYTLMWQSRLLILWVLIKCVLSFFLIQGM